MEIYKLLAKVKAEIGVFAKSEDNNFTNSKYTALSDIFAKINTVLNDNGLLLNIGGLKMDKNLSELAGKLSYSITANLINVNKPEEVLKYEFDIPSDDVGKKMKLIQCAGSTMTYGSRYIYGMIFSLQFADDPDNAENTETGTSAQEHSNTVKIKETNKKGIEISKIQDEVKKNLKFLKSEGITGFETGDKIKKLIKNELRLDKVGDCLDIKMLEAFNNKVAIMAEHHYLTKMMTDMKWIEEAQDLFTFKILGEPLTKCFDKVKLQELRDSIMKEGI